METTNTHGNRSRIAKELFHNGEASKGKFLHNALFWFEKEPNEFELVHNKYGWHASWKLYGDGGDCLYNKGEKPLDAIVSLLLDIMEYLENDHGTSE